MKRIALGLQYDGLAYNGWQTQPHRNTVQDKLEQALSQFAGFPVSVTVAGRTDTGVHGLGQVVHIDVPLERPIFSWVRGVNAFLPKNIVVQWAQEVDTNFHARFTAYERTYFYALYYGSIRAPLLEGRAGYLMLPPGQTLNCAAMQQAAECLIGEHDFSAFRAAECQAKSPIKTMHEITLIEQEDWLFVKFRANAFLHHMVRNLMGSLIAVGRAKQTVQEMKQIFESGNRDLAAPTFMPDGLYLAEVAYPAPYDLPKSNLRASLFHGVFA